MKVQMSLRTDRLLARLPLGRLAAGRPWRRVPRSRSRPRVAGHSHHLLEQRQRSRTARIFSICSSSSTTTTLASEFSRTYGTPRGSWSGRSARRWRRPRARRNRSRSTPAECCRGSRPGRLWRLQGRSGRGRASARSAAPGRSCGRPISRPACSGQRGCCRRARRQRQQVRECLRFGSPSPHRGGSLVQSQLG